MSGVDAAHYALAFRNYIQNFFVETVIELFDTISAGFNVILDVPIPGTPLTIRDILFGDFESLKAKFEDWDFGLIKYFQEIKGITSDAINRTEAILATFTGGLQTMIKEITDFFSKIKDTLVLLANAANPGSGTSIQLAFDQFLANVLPGFSLPIELPSWEDIKAQIEAQGALTMESIKELVLDAPFDILGKLGDLLSLPDPLFPGLSVSALELTHTASTVQDAVSNYFLDVVMQFVDLVIKPVKDLVAGVGDIIDTLSEVADLMTLSFTDLVDIIKSIRFCSQGESWYS
jgi:hypothetical protein